MKKRGFAIILVLATLVLLAMLSLTYIKLALIDRNIARNYVDNKRAKLIAQSGVEYALAKVQEDPVGTGWQNLLNKSIIINGSNTNYTESAGSTYGENRDIFKVNVRDCNSMINVNDGIDNPRVRDNTKRILNVLGDVVGITTLGNKIINNRPPQGYTSKQELLRYLTQDEFNTIKNLVTAHAWQDANVANPVPLSQFMVDATNPDGTPVYPVRYNTGVAGNDIYRYGRGYDSFEMLISGDLKFAPLPFADPASYEHAIYAIDELNPQWIEIVSRSPVNINTVSREVLIALIKDLKGFFVSDRRRNCPQYNYAYDLRDKYIVGSSTITKYSFTYSQGDPIGDELGFLYVTKELDSSLAASIVNEIINCRDKAGSYATKWFGGSFKTWRQFNAFIDDHVGEGKLLNDTRTIFYEYELDPGKATFDQPVNSEVARKQASQAMADVLKANFNSNLHLNETNPDANIKMLVDKTDLIVNSTEFCFTPMGYFQIESEGLLLIDQGGDNTVIANSKIQTIVKLYDAYRETNQKQFLHGKLRSEVEGIPVDNTNNRDTLEIAPEPSHILDAGEPIAKQNEYSGYISLPTMNGPEGTASISITATSTATDPVKTTTSSISSVTTEDIYEELDTPNPGWWTVTTVKKDITTKTTTVTTDTTTNVTTVTSAHGVSLYTHFKDNFNLVYHADGAGYQSNLTDKNGTDRTESGVKGPYEYGLNNRLAKSFRKDSDINTFRAPADFRIDGAYIERHAGLAYGYNGTSTNVLKNQGMVCYWIKPWFYPETTGKPRTFFTLSHFNNWIGNIRNIYFGNYFLPSHWPVPSLGDEDITPIYPSGINYRSTSLLFCFSTLDFWRLPFGGFGHTTPILNHLAHFDPTTGEPLSCHPSGTNPKTNYLKSGQWIHVSGIWQIPAGSEIGSYNDGTSDSNCQVWINGIKLDNSKNIPNGPQYATVLIEDILRSSTIRIGESTIDPTRYLMWSRPWTSDSTVDEFYIFLANDTTTTKEENAIATAVKYDITTTTTTTIVVYDDTGKRVSSDRSTTRDDQTSTEESTSSTVTATATYNPDNLGNLANFVTDMYHKSRYYKPGVQDAYFISGAVDLTLKSKRSPQESIIPNPLITASFPASLNESPIRMIGIAWTWYAETADKAGKVVLKNYKDYKLSADYKVEEIILDPATADANKVLFSEVKVQLIKNRGESDEYTTPESKDDGYSAVNLEISRADTIQYKVIIDLPGIPLDAVLLYSPIFDDITIYYTSPVRYVTFTYFE